MSDNPITLDDYTESTKSDETRQVGPLAISLPSDWSLTELSEVTSDVSEIDHKMPDKVEKGVPFIAVGDIVSSGEIDLESVEQVSEEDWKQLSSKFDPEIDDILYTRFGTIGHAKRVDFNDNFLASYSVALMKLNGHFNSEFLSQCLNWTFLRKQADMRTRGSANKNLNLGEIPKLVVPGPSNLEQRKIATVLYTVDQAIQKTEEIIDQLVEVREGVTQDVFLNGYISHDDFHDVRLGPIRTSAPKDWDVKSIPDYFKIIDGDRGKNYPSGSDFHDEGHCLFLSAKNVTSDGLKFDTTEFITREKDEVLRKGKMKRGDIVMTTRGTVGNFGLYDSSIKYEKMRINSGMVILRPKEMVTSPTYYYRAFRSRIFQRQIDAMSYGTAQPQTSVTDIEKMRFFNPEEDEKEKIADVLGNLTAKIQANKEYRGRLTSTKRGLMQDLLSGTVRTDDVDIAVLDDVLAHG